MKWRSLTIIIVGFIGVILFAGCDKREDILVDETQIEGPVKVRIVKEVQLSVADDHTIEIWDSSGNLRFFLRVAGDSLPEGTFLVHDDGKIWGIKGGKQGYFSAEHVLSDENSDSGKSLDE